MIYLSFFVLTFGLLPIFNAFKGVPGVDMALGISIVFYSLCALRWDYSIDSERRVLRILGGLFHWLPIFENNVPFKAITSVQIYESGPTLFSYLFNRFELRGNVQRKVKVLIKYDHRQYWAHPSSFLLTRGILITPSNPELFCEELRRQL